jgi:hypothetical protein
MQCCGCCCRRPRTLTLTLTLVSPSPNLQAKDVLRVFVEFDIDGNGELDIGEFRAALCIMGVTLPPDRMRKLFKYFDQDDNNMVRPPCDPLPPRAPPPPLLPLPPVATLCLPLPASHQPHTSPSLPLHYPLHQPLAPPNRPLTTPSPAPHLPSPPPHQPLTPPHRPLRSTASSSVTSSSRRCTRRISRWLT